MCPSLPVRSAPRGRPPHDPRASQAAATKAEHRLPKGLMDPEEAARLVVEALAEASGLAPEAFAAAAPDATFADFGMDSVGAIEVATLLGARTGQPLAPSDLMFKFPTVDALARALSARTLRRAFASRSPLVLNDRRASADLPLDGASTLFCMPSVVVGGGGHADAFAYVHLARHLPDWTLVAFEDRKVRDRTPMADLVARTVATIRGLQPEGPWHLLGHSLGGGAFGGRVATALGDCSLILLDGLNPRLWERGEERAAVAADAPNARDPPSAAAARATARPVMAPPVGGGDDCPGLHGVRLRAPPPTTTTTEAGGTAPHGTLMELLCDDDDDDDDPDLRWRGRTETLVTCEGDGGRFRAVGPWYAANLVAKIRRAFADSPYAVAHGRAYDAR